MLPPPGLEGRKVSNYRSAAWLPGGPWALHTGGIYGKRQEGRAPSQPLSRRNSTPLEIVAWACQGRGRDWGKKLRMGRKRKLCRGVREEKCPEKGQVGVGNPFPQAPWRVWPNWAPEGGSPDSKTMASQLPCLFLAWKMGRCPAG